MPCTTIEEVNERILRWRDQISASLEEVRRLQDALILDVGPEFMLYATTTTSMILGKGGLLMSNVNNTTIGTAGVAITGGSVGGNVSGTATNIGSGVEQRVREGLSKLEASLQSSTELSNEQKEEAQSALEDLAIETNRPETERKPGRVRNALKVLSGAVTIAKGAEFLYQDVLPHIEAFFHLAK